ncbi:MAG: Gfo/Idh/MocA family oxidoreductase [Pirellulales bacterium]|nr:Gfo/Idh/MocA family oxidoreductase [Pirellulales bacterium]
MIYVFAVSTGFSAGPAGQIRIGIIGTDTSHVPAFTKMFNDPKAVGELAEMSVVAAYPGGSPDLPASWDRVKKYSDELRGMGIEIVDSIEELLDRVDAVLLESVDGRPHLAQARPVIAAGKPLFIDKPMAASLADAMEIFRMAKENGVPCFSSSSLRFNSGFQAAASGETFGKVRACAAWSPLNIEPHHPDLFWYGIHGVEILFTIMGPGCEEVKRVAPDKVEGVWKDGRRGAFVAKKDYGASVEGEKGAGDAGKHKGYEPLVVEIAKFFKTGKPPVSAEETLEILAFMEAADQSKRLGGAAVKIADVMRKAEEKNAAGDKK